VTIAIATIAVCLLAIGAVAALERRPQVAPVRVRSAKRRQASSDS
jgi:hypothetical protein